MSNQKALILHAWYSKSDSNWYHWLKKQLEDKKYETFLPEIPTFNTNAPQLKTSIEFIEKNYPVDANTTVIGHGLGCLLALRLAEKYMYRKMILVAGWDYDDLTKEHESFWPNKINHTKIKENVKEIYCVSSDNDPYTTLFQVTEMSKRLGGKLISIRHGGHFATKEKCEALPELTLGASAQTGFRSAKP